jgi:hypothetical protein
VGEALRPAETLDPNARDVRWFVRHAARVPASHVSAARPFRRRALAA